MCPSEEKKPGHDTAFGRGVYTSEKWAKAMQYAIPVLLHKSQLFTKIILLLAVPGGESEGGVGVWEKADGNEWEQEEDIPGGWKKVPSGWYVREESEPSLPSGSKKMELKDRVAIRVVVAVGAAAAAAVVVVVKLGRTLQWWW